MPIEGSAKSYRVFVRDFWRKDAHGKIVPYYGAPKRTLATRCTEEEARNLCLNYRHTYSPGWRSRKAEYEEE